MIRHVEIIALSSIVQLGTHISMKYCGNKLIVIDSIHEQSDMQKIKDDG